MKKSTLIICAILTLVVVMGGIYYVSQLDWDYQKLKATFSSTEEFRSFILSFGIWAPVAFFVTQVIQVIVSPIPGNITGLVGGALFGWVMGFTLNGAGILIGSVIAFFIARIFGQSIVIRLIGPNVFNRYNSVFQSKFVFGLFLIFLFPFFPDDALCFLAGLSSLPFPLFILLIVVGRLPGMLVASLAGSGVLVFSLWHWVIIGVISLVLIYLVIKYRKGVEDWFHRLVGLGTEDNA